MLLLFGAFQATWAGDSWAPLQYEIDRYAHIWKSAPFTASTEVAAAGGSLAARYAVTGFARVGDEEVVFLFDRKGLERFSVTKSRPGNGVELLALQETGDLKGLKARIRVGGEVALVAYDRGVTEAAPSVSREAAPPAGESQAEATGPAVENVSAGAPRNARVLMRREVTIQP